MMYGNDIDVAWNSDQKKVKKKNKNYFIDQDLVKVIVNEMKDIRLKDTPEQLQPPKMGTELSFMHTHIFKDRSGTTGLMFILRK